MSINKENNSTYSRISISLASPEEIKAQSDKVIALFHDMESKYSEEQLEEIKELLVESSALYAVYNYYSIQNIDK